MFPWDLISLAAVFWMSRNAPPKQRCVTSKKRLRGRLPRTFIRKKNIQAKEFYKDLKERRRQRQQEPQKEK